MRILISFLVSIFSLTLWSQTKEISRANDYYTAYIKEGKLADIEKAYELVSQGMTNSQNMENDIANFTYAYITKQYYELKNPSDKSELTEKVSQALLKSYKLNSQLKDKDKLFRTMQIIGYDLYSEGIQLFKSNQNLKAYQLYKNLVQIQDVLAQNNLNFKLTSSTGEETDIKNSDIMNNLAIFSMNCGKQDEAKSIFKNELSTNPSALGYSKLIQICQQTGDKLNADKYIQEGLSKYPYDSDLLVYGINQNLDSNQFEKAINLIDRAIEKEPNPNLYLVKSQTLVNQEKYEDAIANYGIALKFYPDNFDINYGMGYALFNQALKIINEKNDQTKFQAIDMLGKAKTYFNKAKSIDADKTDFNKLFETVNSIKY